MVTAAALATVLGYWFVGAVLFRALAAQLLRYDNHLIGTTGATDRDLILQSALPALALTGTIGTYLALFRILRADVTIVMGLVVLALRWRDTRAVACALGCLTADGIRRVLDLNLFVLAGLGAVVGLTGLLFFYSQIPSVNVDTWVFQLPLARSIASHHGFIYPQINHIFYSNNPLFFNLLFAQALLFVDHYVAADAVNVLIYVGFLITLASFAPRNRPIAWLVVLYFIASSSYFSMGATEPLIDLPRSCYTVAALLFAYRYWLTPRLYELTVAGLLAGAALAGKYTELITLVLIGIGLLPTVLSDRRRWLHVLTFATVVTIVASYWYLKNIILLHNPIYPFLFGHSGLSNEWMAEYMLDIGRPFDPADRSYVTNLLTLQGWRDFFYILYTRFFENRLAAQIAGIGIAIGLAVLRVRVGLLTLWTALLFVIWYSLMFNSIRWAIPANLLMLSTGFLAYAFLYDRIAAAAGTLFSPLPNWRAAVLDLLRKARHSGLWLGVCAALTIVMLSVGASAIKYVAHPERLIPAWASRDLMPVLTGRMTFDDYLTSHREGYRLYRYVGQHDLRKVFQPFDNGAESYSAAYNGGRDGAWFLPYRTLPRPDQSVESFIAETAIRYFVYQPGWKEIQIDRFGQDHVDRANAVLAVLLPRSRPLLTDSFGWTLYEIIDPPR